MEELFIMDGKETICHSELIKPEDNLPQTLVVLLDQWEALIKIREKYSQYTCKFKDGVFFFKLNEDYHLALREEMYVFDLICDYASSECKVFYGRLELLCT